MAPRAVVQRNKRIFELLSDSDVKTVILVGDSGVGKTWTARQISNYAVKKDLFDFAFWIFVDKKFDDQAVCESIARQLSPRQLSLLSIADEWEPEDGNNEAEKKDEDHKVSREMIADFLEGKSFLLILDYGRNKMEEVNIMSDLKRVLNLHNQSSYKVLITSEKSVSSNDADEEVIPAPPGDEEVIPAPTGHEMLFRFKPLPKDEALSFLRERVGGDVYDDPSIKALAEASIEKTKYLPAAIIVMAKAISYCTKHDSGLRMLKSALEADDTKCFNIVQLLHSGYDALPRSIVIDCCRRGNHFFCDRGSIHYNELIAYWIMEGYLGHVNCLEKAYEEGHSVFMELVDCQVFKKLEGGYVIMDKAIQNFDDCDRYGFGGTARLGLADLSEDGDWKGFGRITQTNGKIKSLSTGKKKQKLSTLFLCGNHCVEMLDDSASWKEEIEVLALFNPTFKSLPELLADMPKLFVLVLRGCVFLEEINHKHKFQKLTVLEISNASSLKNIPNDFFDHMLQLRSLHISELKVDPLPPSLENLRELRWLILRECSSFKTLNSLRNFQDLMVLDVSGATSLVNFKDKTFKATPKLQTLNLSRTSIKSVPKFLNLGELTHISLSGCNSLDRLPKTDALPKLQTLNLSGAKSFKEFHEQSLRNPLEPKILDLSGTPLGSLPSKINPRHLFLKNCTELKKLPCIEALEGLEVLDLSGTKSLVEIENNFFSCLKSLQILNLSETSITTLPSLSNSSYVRQLLLSGCTALTVIEDKSFEHMSSLQQLDVSQTMIKFLPSLSNLSSLSFLSLHNCTHLTKLPPLDHLSNLEELNLSGVSALKENGAGAGFLEHMSHLRILDLSETPLAQLPSLSNLKSLTQLFLSGCKSLQAVPNLDGLTRLEVLDLSGTGIKCLPSLDNFSNLRKLLLDGCSSLEGFPQVDSLDQLGTTVRELPCGISKLTNLECLDLPSTKNTQGGESGNTSSLPEVVDACHWGIASLQDETPVDCEKPPIFLSGNQFLQSLKNNSSLLKTNSKRFHLCVNPTMVQNKTGDTFSYRNDLIFRDFRFQTAELVRFKELRSVEIHGFSLFPTGVEVVLCNADCVFFINNTFTKWLSDIDVSSLKAMKGCWIERCTDMEGVFHEGKEDDIAKLGETLEVLGISNAISLNSIYGGKLPSRGFQKLQSLYLDCCPKLPTVFSASQLPENLQVLQVKFCDKLESVFEQSSPDALQKLTTLHLWELPELKSIGCRLPSLLTLKVWECPKLQKLEDSISSAKGLQTLWISNVADLKSIYSGSRQPERLKDLETLVLESCPKLENVLSSPQAPPSLKTLSIKSCGEVMAVFDHNSSSDYILEKLETLHLYKLPKLEKIGGKRPNVQNAVIMGCPNCRGSTAA